MLEEATMGKYVIRGAIALSAAALALQFAVARPAEAQSVEQFYTGRTITLLIPSSPGGVNDLAARLVAENLGRHIPGNPQIVVENLPSASGAVLANRLYTTSERDGSVIAIIERAVPQLAVQGDPDAKFDPLQMNWLGSLSSYANDAFILAINASSPVHSVADLKTNAMSIRIGAMGPGITNLTFALLSKELLGLNVEIKRGYSGAAPIFLAMRSGEVDGQVVGLNSLKGAQKQLWDNHLVRPIVQFARSTRLPELSDVPTGRELLKDPKDLALLEFAEQPFFMALPFAAPPGVPAERVKALQDAFMAMTTDPAYLAGAQKLSLDTSPIDGDAIRELLLRSAATPKDVIAHYNQITGMTP
jgi:tripartite-type tricarboxylate transporter receptor subunit TctC